MSRHPFNSSSQRGYSLAEILVAVAVFAIIFIAALAMYDQSNRVFKRGVEAAETQQNVRVAFDKLVADLRMAGFDFDRDGIPTAASGSPWQPTRTYGIGNMVVPPVLNGFLYRMQSVSPSGTSCTSSAGPVAWSTTIGNIVPDNNCRWVTLQGINQYQQPDEQIEFAHPSAVTIRGNFDFELNQPGDLENGREVTLETPQFPVITTGNDEIVTYALKSVSGTTNNYDIRFYADTATFTPAGASVTNRAAFVGGRPGGENEVMIQDVNIGVATGVGCTASNPCFPDAPYTLYRYTLGPNGTTAIETPLATNIRSIHFDYYRNVTGVPPAAAPTGWASLTQLTNPGGGQFSPTIPAQGITERSTRSTIRSVRVTIIGMSEGPEPNYVNPIEPATSNILNYHTYRLESLIVPRNLGKQGMREIPPNPPGAPTLQDIIYGYCGGVTLSWVAPINQPGQGQVESYIIEWNTVNDGTFPFVKDVGPNTSGTVTNLDPNTTYYFTVEAINSYGKQIALVPGTATVAVISALPQNSTTPGSPNTDPANPAQGIAPGTVGGAYATGGGMPTSPAEVNQITVTWEPPTRNLVGNTNGTQKLASGSTSPILVNPLYGEITTWEVYRGTTANFAPDPTPVTGNMLSTTSPSPNTISSTLTQVAFVDKTALNCVTYYYKVRGVERCRDNTACPSCNISGANGYTPFYPLAIQPGIPGKAAANQKPAKPQTLQLQLMPPDPGATAPGLATWCTPSKCGNVYLRWPRVKADDQTPANRLNIAEYDVIRDQYDYCAACPGGISATSSASVTFNVTDPTPSSTQFMLWTDTSNIDIRDASNDPIYYKYYVVAKQCPTGAAPPFQFMSDPSESLLFPCTFDPAATYTIDLSMALDGDGMAQPTAWLTNNPLSAVVVSSVGLTSVQAVLESGGRVIDLGTISGAGPTYTFPLLQTQIGEMYTLYVVLKDSVGCSRVETRYVEEATATGCCLANFDTDTSVVSYIPGTSFVDITFRNLCTQNLDIMPLGVDFTWDPVIANNSTGTSTTLTSVEFPSSTGTGSAILSTAPLPDIAPAGATLPRSLSLTPPTSTVPPAKTAIAGGSSNYTIRLNFNRILVNANSPITDACVIYQRPGVDTANQNCNILSPAPTPFNTCNP